MNSTLQEVKQSLEKMTRRGPFKAIINCLKDAQALREHNAKVDEACQLFNVSPRQVLDYYQCLLRRSEVIWHCTTRLRSK